MKDRIKLIRKDAGLTQTQFGKVLANKSLSTVQKWEMGINVPDSPSIKQICQEFGVNETWLRTGSGSMTVSKTREQELAGLFRSLMADRPESFRSMLVSTLLRFDPNGPEWDALEKLFDSIVKEAEQYRDQEK
jgi:transcriptional regulator with XRE-family HTH domain